MTNSETDYHPIGNHRSISLLTQGHSNPFVAKTAISLLRYRSQDIVAVVDDQVDAANVNELFGLMGEPGLIPVVPTLPKQSDALYIGIAPPGGQLPKAWKPILLAAIEQEMDLVSGLHDFVSHDQELVRAAKQNGVRLLDVRKNDYSNIATGQPFRAGCIRVLTVGHDCSVGKMVTALEVDQELRRRGRDSRFLATGQTGIMITGAGVPVDRVIVDFVNGAVEQLVRQHDEHSFLLIEGQGSISHPAYSAVTVGLLHGSRPQAMIYCYEAGRTHVKGLDGIKLPSLREQMECYRAMAALHQPAQFVGIAANTRTLSAMQARDELDRVEQELGLPACDVYRDGAGKLVDECLKLEQND